MRQLRLRSWWKHLHWLGYLLLAVVVLGPGLAAGRLFLVDMPWPAEFSYDQIVATKSPQMPLTLLLWLANQIIPADIVQKLVLLFVITLAGAGMRQLVVFLRGWSTSAWLAGAIYAFNPFVLQRLVAGQWLVLLGYGFAPWFVYLFLRWYVQPSSRRWPWLALAFAIYPVLSLHWWFMVTLCLLPLAVVRLIALSRKPGGLWWIAKNLLLGAAIWVGCNALWLWQIVTGDSALQRIGPVDYAVFATPNDGFLGALGLVLSLYGFWQNDQFLPKDRFVGWPLATVLLMGLAAAGIYGLWRRKRAAAVYLLIVYGLSAVFAVGYGSTWSRPLVDFLFRYIPGFNGLRETAKAVGVLAFCYAVLLPFGISQAGEWLRGLLGKVTKKQVERLIAGLIVVTLLLCWGSGLWGNGGQLRTYSYPAGWVGAKQFLEGTNESVLALPWRGYLRLDFADQAFAANPTKAYFGGEVIQSATADNLRLDESREDDPYDIVIYQLLYGNQAAAVQALRGLRVEYLLLIKTADWNVYAERLRSLELYEAVSNDDVVIYQL